MSEPNEQTFQQAVGLYEAGQWEEAAALFTALIERHPQHFPALHRLAAIRRQQERLEESLALLKQAIGCKPGAADVHNSLGNTLNSLGRHEEAADQYRCAIALRPEIPEVHLNLGNTLKTLGRYQEAASAYAAAIALRPQYAEAHSCLGITFIRLNRPQDAIASFTAAIALDPSIKIVYSNLGAALTALNRHEEALPIFQRARQLEPDAPQPAFNEAITRLALGDFDRGWRDYEARWRAPELKMEPRDFPQPLWDGQANLSGKTILLYAEQGLGDTILFARFVPLVVERGAHVVLEVQPALARLMSALPGVAQTVVHGDALPDFDFHAPFGSLPMIFRTTLETIPSQVPYIQAPASTLETPPDPRLRVGVCWAGNPNYALDHNRSIPLEIFARVFATPGVRFVSLQPILRPGDDRILAGFDNIDVVSIRSVTELNATAALIATLDLVITVDTVVGHLTGALARPVWLLVAYYPYWVWLRGRTDSPWYPTARLFRQARIGDWREVMERVAAGLSEAVSLRAAAQSRAQGSS